MTGKNNSTEHTQYFNFKSLSQMKIKNIKSSDCPTCAGVVEYEVNDFEVDASILHDENIIFVDVRDQEDSVLEAYKSSTKKIIIGCHRGVRSKRLVKSMREQGFGNFYSLKGGAPAEKACCHQ